MIKNLIKALLLVFNLLACRCAFSQAPVIDYKTPQIFTIGVPIAALKPTKKGGDVPPGGFKINILLPAGLSLNPDNGEITGTPIQLSPATIYTITATNADGLSQATLNIKVGYPAVPIPAAPAIFYNTSENLYILKTPIPDLVLQNSGGKVMPGMSNGLLENYAGTGIAGNTDGPKNSATINGPGQLIFNTSGDLLFPEAVNFDVRKISAPGLVSVYAAQIASNGFGVIGPRAIAIDSKGNVFVADALIIRKITPGGALSIFAGGSSAGYADGNGSKASFDGIVGIAIDKNDNLFVTDQNNTEIRKITPNADVITFAGNRLRGNTDGQGITATFNSPYGITVDAKGNILVADYLTIRKITPTGLVSTIAGNTLHKVQDGQGTAASFGNAVGITIDAAGRIYILDTGNSVPNEGSDVLRMIDQNNQVTTVNLVTGDGSRNFLSQPTGLAFDKMGYLYISGNNNFIQTVSTDRFLIDKALPQGLVFDEATGNITGTPTELWPTTEYTVTAFNSGGIAATKVIIKVVRSETPLAAVIAFPDFASPAVWDSNFNVDPRVTSNNEDTPIILTSSNPNIIAVNADGKTLRILSPGEATITASQKGNADYLDANPVSKTINIQKANAVLNLMAIDQKSVCDDDFTLITASNSPAPVAYTSSNPDVATVNLNGLVHLVGPGTATITVAQASSLLYNSSLPAEKTIIVTAINAQLPVPTVAISATSKIFYEGGTATFKVTASEVAVKYQWQVNDTNAGENSAKFTTNTLSNQDKITCTVSFQNKCILPVASNAITVTVLPPPITIAAPNTFTPNNDGVNDTWLIPALISYPNCLVSVFNRNGSIILQSSGYNKPWDGTYNGKELPVATYYYTIDTRDGQAKLSGSITILR